jgi:hypothetical protein
MTITVLCLLRLCHPFYYSECLITDLRYLISSMHVEEINAAENSIKEILIDLMDEKVSSIGFQASSTRGVQASPSTSCGSGPSLAMIEKINKHHDDLENTRLIPSILPSYIPDLVGVVSHDSVSRDFDYTVITAYLLKGIHIVIT